MQCTRLKSAWRSPDPLDAIAPPSSRRNQERRRPPSLLIRSAVPFFVLLYLSFATAFTPFTQQPRRIRERPPTQLYGIKGFRAWFESQFPDAITGIPSKGSQEFFDHVLIDINQLLHVAVRRSTSDDHALAILMRELNACIELATPTKSLVLAMDGPPSAAKLATSRKRRLATLVKAEWKQAQLSRVQKSRKLRMNTHKEKRLRRRYAAEVETLRITPGTNFMERANQAMLYWAWQRMIPQDGPLSKVSIYISASDSPGEGEVKILDWILRKRPQGTLAIMGGDSDLVLEGLVIPPSICTHNVFVLLPGLGKRYLVVSLWETTRHLAQLLPQLKAEDIMRVRTDMVLLLIMNGNDYLPKLRGSSGFNRVFRAYIQVVREWLEEGKEHPFLIDPDSLVFHLEFAIDFFGRLKLDRPLESAANIAEQQFAAITPLGQLNNLVSTQFMPKPIRWQMISDDPNPSVESQLKYDEALAAADFDDDDDAEHDDDDVVDFTEDDIIEEIDKDDEDAFEDEEDEEEFLGFDASRSQAKLRLTLGKVGTPEYHCYEIEYLPDSKVKDRKNELAKVALEDLLGEDFMESCNDTLTLTPSGYSWELNSPVDSDCKLYLGGLLWNLQTYQDGICSDYGYNYGKRLSPTAEDVVDFFQQALNENRQVGKNDLLTSAFTPPVKNGVSCLAALPSQIGNLIAEPYSTIPSETIEQFYSECVSRIDNSFDIRKFSALCEAEVSKSMVGKKKSTGKTDEGLKKVGLGEDYWTVVFRSFKPQEPPFAPPPPVIEKFTPLFVNRRIKAARFAASSEPRQRSVWMNNGREVINKTIMLPDDIDHCGMRELLATSKGGSSVFDIDYWMPFPNRWGKPPAKQRGVRTATIANGQRASNAGQIPAEGYTISHPGSRKKSKGLSDLEVEERVKAFSIEIDISRHPLGSKTGVSPLEYLTQLEESDMIEFEWMSTIPSPTEFASISPNEFECVQLVVRKGNVSINSAFSRELVFQRDIKVKSGNKEEIKQFLASLALTRMLAHMNKNWFEMSFQELKRALTPEYEVVSKHGAVPSTTEVYTISDAKHETRKKVKRLSDKEIESRIKEFNMEIDVSHHPPLSKDGVSPLEYLKLLEQLDMIDFEWKSTIPSQTDFASISPDEFECVELVVRKGDVPINSTFTRELVFQRDREVTRGSKQQIKQYLASLALTRLLGQTGKKWFEMTFYELKNVLIPDYEIILKPRLSEVELKRRMADFKMEPLGSTELSVSDHTALEYLGHLQQDKLINMTFKSIYPSPTEFASVSPEDFECLQLIVTMTKRQLANPFVGELAFERDRLLGRDQKRIKQYLAGLALARLLDHVECAWTELTYKECKARLKVPSEVGIDHK